MKNILNHSCSSINTQLIRWTEVAEDISKLHEMKVALDVQPTTSFAETAPSHLVNFKKSYLVKPLSSTFGRSKLFHHFKNICGKRKISWMFYSVDQSMPGIWRVKTKFCGLDETWCNSFWFNKVVLNCKLQILFNNIIFFTSISISKQKINTISEIKSLAWIYVGLG